MKQCAVLFVDASRKAVHLSGFLRRNGFVVREIPEWPRDSNTVRDYHVVVVAFRDIAEAPMLAARLRAKPYFDRRLLIAAVSSSASDAERRAAQAAGFDDVADATATGRDLAARILRGLRTRPELRCALPPQNRRPAA